jgi:hypothetical protein
MPEKNGVAERPWRTLWGMVRCMLLESSLPVELWQEALAYAIYIYDRVPHSGINSTIPNQAWDGGATDLSHLRLRAYWRCTAADATQASGARMARRPGGHGAGGIPRVQPYHASSLQR